MEMIFYRFITESLFLSRKQTVIVSPNTVCNNYFCVYAAWFKWAEAVFLSNGIAILIGNVCI